MGSKMRRWLVAVCIIHLTAVGVFLRVHRGDRGNAVTNHADVSAQVVRSKSSATPPRSSSSLYFHHARADRSGAVLEDMLLAHAHSFYNNLTYGGACATEPLPHRASHDQLIRLLGLQHILKFACPAAVAAVGENASSSSFVSGRHGDPPMHRRFNTRIFRPEWLAVVRGEHVRHRTFVSPPPTPRQSGTRTESVVIHIRRGDVSLCDPVTADRYLPNQHYVSLIESLLRNRMGDGGVPLSIEVYSEEHSEPEGWEGLLQQISPIVDHHRLSLYVNASASLAWSRMIQADVLVLSKSSFSFVPAIFTAAKEVLYTPFWLDPLPNWTIVDENLMQTTRRANLRLRHELCNHTGDGA
jgi:hypothetical protein